jgi:hypothetical protein
VPVELCPRLKKFEQRVNPQMSLAAVIISRAQGRQFEARGPKARSVVTAGLGLGVHEFAAKKLVDARAKPGHDDRELSPANDSSSASESTC